jgi:hypothetical protein
LFKSYVYKLKYILPFFLLSNTSSDNVNTKVENISFNIINKNKNIGFIDIEKRDLEHTTTYIVNSEVNTKVIFNFSATGREKSIYRTDTLIYSSIFRKLNKKIKLDQRLTLDNGRYILNYKKNNEVLDFEVIKRNLVTLFFYEPIGVQQVYSDKYKKMVDINAQGKGKYKVVLPNKSVNIYHYDKGTCTRIDVKGSFFKVKLILEVNKQH